MGDLPEYTTNQGDLKIPKSMFPYSLVVKYDSFRPNFQFDEAVYAYSVFSDKGIDFIEVQETFEEAN
jgi:hypothetical protein